MTKPLRRRTTMEVRVDHVMARMVACAWSAKEAQDCARKWGVSETVVKTVAAEASRAIARHAEVDPAEMRAKILAAVEDVVAQCRKTKNWSATIKALDILAKAHGVYAPTQVNVTGDLASMSEEAVEKRRQELIARISADGAAEKGTH
jgi:hypothetical protein